jgi:hypothetical protein
MKVARIGLRNVLLVLLFRLFLALYIRLRVFHVSVIVLTDLMLVVMIVMVLLELSSMLVLQVKLPRGILFQGVHTWLLHVVDT